MRFRNFLSRAAGYLLLPTFFIFSSCVTPPPELSPSVLPQQELQLVTLLKQGQDYASSGRFDLAEREFRLALRIAPELPSIYNNLGFVLSQQSRMDEAIKNYEHAIALDPINWRAKDNLARVYYVKGDFVSARKAYAELIEWLEDGYELGLLARLGRRPSDYWIADLHRNLAVTEYLLGNLESALCHSNKALEKKNDITETVLHGRLLLSLEKLEASQMLFRTAVTRNGNQSPQLVDYAITLFLQEQFRLSDRAADRVLALSNASASDRVTAALLKLMVANAAPEQAVGFEAARDTLVEILVKQCDAEKQYTPELYWPVEFNENARLTQARVCDGEFNS